MPRKKSNTNQESADSTPKVKRETHKYSLNNNVLDKISGHPCTIISLDFDNKGRACYCVDVGYHELAWRRQSELRLPKNKKDTYDDSEP